MMKKEDMWEGLRVAQETLVAISPRQVGGLSLGEVEGLWLRLLLLRVHIDRGMTIAQSRGEYLGSLGEVEDMSEFTVVGEAT